MFPPNYMKSFDSVPPERAPPDTAGPQTVQPLLPSPLGYHTSKAFSMILVPPPIPIDEEFVIDAC